jgi:hypothetical protein
MESPLGENRGGTPIGERASEARAAPAGAAVVPRLSAFRFPFSSLLALVAQSLIVTAPVTTAGVI